MSQVRIFEMGCKERAKPYPKRLLDGKIAMQHTVHYEHYIVPSSYHPFFDEIGLATFARDDHYAVSRSLFKKLRNHKEIEIQYVRENTEETSE